MLLKFLMNVCFFTSKKVISDPLSTCRPYMYIGGGSVSGKLMILVPPNLHPIILFEPIPVYGCISNRHVRCFFSVWWAGQQTDRYTESITFYLGHYNTMNFLDWTLKRSIRFFFSLNSKICGPITPA